MLADRQCDAIVLYTRHMSEKKIMSLIESIAMPLVVINRDVSEARSAACSSNSRTRRFRRLSTSLPGAIAILPV